MEWVGKPVSEPSRAYGMTSRNGRLGTKGWPILLAAIAAAAAAASCSPFILPSRSNAGFNTDLAKICRLCHRSSTYAVTSITLQSAIEVPKVQGSDVRALTGGTSAGITEACKHIREACNVWLRLQVKKLVPGPKDANSCKCLPCWLW